MEAQPWPLCLLRSECAFIWVSREALTLTLLFLIPCHTLIAAAMNRLRPLSSLSGSPVPHLYANVYPMVLLSVIARLTQLTIPTTELEFNKFRRIFSNILLHCHRPTARCDKLSPSFVVLVNNIDNYAN